VGQHRKPERDHPKSEDGQEADDAARRQCDANRDAIRRSRRTSDFAHHPRHAVRDPLLQAVELFVEVWLVVTHTEQGTASSFRSSGKKHRKTTGNDGRRAIPPALAFSPQKARFTFYFSDTNQGFSHGIAP